MTQMDRDLRLWGRIFITGAIYVVTGLHIGAGRTPLTLGGVENPVVRDPMTWRPYIPGSSLKGKLRALLEKHYNKSQQWTNDGVHMHTCYTFDERGNRVSDLEMYARCEICPVFGTPADFAIQPTRLIVRDVPLDDESASRLALARTDWPFTEVKWETNLDRVTSAATPRQIERVPAGSVFAPMELIYSVYTEIDLNRFTHVLDGMRLIEDDYLGGLGSRGSGKVIFQDLTVSLRGRDHRIKAEIYSKGLSLNELLAHEEDMMNWLHRLLFS